MSIFFTNNSKKKLDVDEIFFDAHVWRKDNWGDKLEQSLLGKPFVIFLFIVLFFLSFLFLRVINLSTLNHKFYASLADNNYKRVQYNLAPRGIIYDRFGDQLVFNIPSLDMALIPNEFPIEHSKQEMVFEELAKIINFEKPNPAILLAGSAEPILLKEDISIDTALSLENKINYFPGIKIEKNFRRQYKDGSVFSHLIGYTGKPSAVEVVGKDGVEAFYDNVLRGQNGRRELEVDAFGKTRKDVLISDFKKGNDIALTINAKLQKKLFESLKNRLVGQGGAAIAIDPRNGEILSLVSLPSFDNNSLLFINDPLHPFFNRAISGEYPAGSTIKPFIGAAALQEKVINEDSAILDKGAIYIHNKYNPEIVYTYSSYAPLGLLNIKQALAYSSNVFFYTLGGGYESFIGLGIDKIYKYLKLFYFDSKTGIDLSGESRGLLPTPLWKETVKKEQWVTGDTYNVSVGQGDSTATPLQLISAFSAIINGGVIFQPHLLKNNPAHILRTNFIDKKNLDIVKDGLRDSVLYGTSKALNTLPIIAGGKTGTAQRGDNLNDLYAWSLSFAPFNNPEIAIVVLVEGGKGGSTNAVPVAREVLEWYFK